MANGRERVGVFGFRGPIREVVAGRDVAGPFQRGPLMQRFQEIWDVHFDTTSRDDLLEDIEQADSSLAHAEHELSESLEHSRVLIIDDPAPNRELTEIMRAVRDARTRVGALHGYVGSIRIKESQ